MGWSGSGDGGGGVKRALAVVLMTPPTFTPVEWPSLHQNIRPHTPIKPKLEKKNLLGSFSLGKLRINCHSATKTSPCALRQSTLPRGSVRIFPCNIPKLPLGPEGEWTGICPGGLCPSELMPAQSEPLHRKQEKNNSWHAFRRLCFSCTRAALKSSDPWRVFRTRCVPSASPSVVGVMRPKLVKWEVTVVMWALNGVNAFECLSQSRMKQWRMREFYHVKCGYQLHPRSFYFETLHSIQLLSFMHKDSQLFCLTPSNQFHC